MANKVAASILTFNAVSTGRLDDLQRTYNSLKEADYLFVLDGGSTDGSFSEISKICPEAVYNQDGNLIIGHSMNLAINMAMASGAEIILFSADDLEYYPGWRDKLVDFWTDESNSAIMATLHLEPDYPWNRPNSAATVGNQRVLYRETIPGCCWSFLARNWHVVGPVPETKTEDLITCRRLRGLGYNLGALDLADHIGEQRSAWGNQSWRIARPLNKSIWGF